MSDLKINYVKPKQHLLRFPEVQYYFVSLEYLMYLSLN